MAYPRFASRLLETRLVALASVSLALCAACGGSSSDDSSSTGGSKSSGGSTSSAGTTSSAGASTGGSGTGGSTSTGGTTSGGATSTAGASAGGTTSSGGTTSTGGKPSSGGTGGAADCATLRSNYEATVQKARSCDSGSSDECVAGSTMPAVGGCGCPTFVNAKSPDTALAKMQYQAFQDAKCGIGPICNIACIVGSSPSCSLQNTDSSTGYVCSGGPGTIN